MSLLFLAVILAPYEITRRIAKPEASERTFTILGTMMAVAGIVLLA